MPGVRVRNPVDEDDGMPPNLNRSVAFTLSTDMTPNTYSGEPKIYNMAKDRINEKRSFFGSQAIKIVTDFFKGDEFQNNRLKIAEYAMWATRIDGPAVWEIPTPIDCLFPNTSSRYIKPQNIFQSDFIISLLSSFMKSCQGSRFDFGPLVGAVGMAAAAVERAFLLFITGERAEKGSIGNFSREKVGYLVDDYIENAKKLSNHRWRSIEESCGLKFQQEQPVPLNAPLMQEKRRALYEPSSPMNSDEE